MRTAKQTAKFNQEQHQHQITSAIAFSAQKAVEVALSSPEIRKLFEDKFALYLSALAPMEATRALMVSLADYDDSADFARRYPQFAGVIAEAWSKALKDVVDIFRSGNEKAAIQKEFNLNPIKLEEHSL